MKQMTPLLRLDTKRFRSPTNLSLLLWGTVLRLALLAGYPVVLVGACRTGKTLLLSKLTPGKIVDKRDEAISGKRPIVITSDEVPDGRFSLDECQLIESSSICELTSAMTIQKRPFCLAVQRYEDIKDAVDTYRESEHPKRVILVVVGGESNPATILDELRNCEKRRKLEKHDITPEESVKISLENAKREKATRILNSCFAPIYLLNGEVVDKDRFKRESGMGHLNTCRRNAAKMKNSKKNIIQWVWVGGMFFGLIAMIIAFINFPVEHLLIGQYGWYDCLFIIGTAIGFYSVKQANYEE